MNRRNKGKSGAQTTLKNASSNKIVATPTPTPTPAAPSVSASPSALKSAPPVPSASTTPLASLKPPPGSAPPPPTQCDLLRTEWKLFQGWLKDRRSERDQRLAEARAPLKPTRIIPFNRKPATQPLDTASLAQLEYKLNQELCTSARAEWEKRIGAKGLREEDWTDISEAEMRAVEDAFLAPEPVPQSSITGASKEPGRYGLSGNSLSGNTLNLGSEPAPPTNSPSAWGPSSTLQDEDPWTSFAPSKPSQYPTSQSTSRNASHFGDISNQHSSHVPLVSGHRQDVNHDYQLSAFDANEVSLWSSVMSGRKTPASSGPAHPKDVGPQESLWEATMREKGNGATTSQKAPILSGDSTESLWEAARSGKASGLSSKPLQDTQESPWEAAMRARTQGAASMERSSSLYSQDTSDSPWDSTRTPTSISRSTSASSVDPRDVPWQDFAQGRTRSSTNKPHVSSPLASYEPQIYEPSPAHRVINPTTIELEENDHVIAGFEGLSQEDLEYSIRQFYSMAAEAEIELRRQLYLPGVELQQQVELLDEFVRGMEETSRGIWEGWKELREKETARQRQVAEAERERERKMAEMAKKPLWGTAAKRVQEPSRVTTPVSSPSPAVNRKQAKKAGKKPLDADPEPLETNKSGDSPQNPVPVRAEDDSAVRSQVPATGRNMWSAASARASSPAPSSNKSAFNSAQQSATSWSVPKKPSGLGRATVADEVEEEDENGQTERIFEEKRAAEDLAQSLASPFKWMNADAPGGRSSSPKPEFQSRPSANARVPVRDKVVPERAGWNSNKPAATNPRFRTWAPEPTKSEYDDDGTRALMEAAMRNLQDDGSRAMMEAAMRHLQHDSAGQQEHEQEDAFNTMSAYTQAARVSRPLAGRQRTTSTTRR